MFNFFGNSNGSVGNEDKKQPRLIFRSPSGNTPFAVASHDLIETVLFGTPTTFLFSRDKNKKLSSSKTQSTSEVQTQDKAPTPSVRYF